MVVCPITMNKNYPIFYILYRLSNLCKNGWTDLDAVWSWLVSPRNHVLDGYPDPTRKGALLGNMVTRRRWGFCQSSLDTFMSYIWSELWMPVLVLMLKSGIGEWIDEWRKDDVQQVILLFGIVNCAWPPPVTLHNHDLEGTSRFTLKMAISVYGQVYL